MKQQRVSLFKSLQTVPSKAVGWQEIVRLIRYDDDVRLKTEKYRRIRQNVGKREADSQVKEGEMPAFSVAVLFDGNGRKAQYVLGFTGLALVDIDHVEDVNEAFEKVKADPHTMLAYRTVSGEGLRVIYRYQRDGGGHLDSTSWPAAFLKGNRYYAELTGCAFDGQCGDYGRLSGLAHDQEMYEYPDAEPFVITDEEILVANFDPASGNDRKRKEYETGAFTVGVEAAWGRIEQELQKRQLVYQAGHHHDYVMHAAFLFNRYGAGLDELLEWAAQEWSDYDARQRERTIRSCYKKTAEHGTWKLHKPKKGRENAMITLPEIREWLRQHVDVVYNLVTDQTMYRILSPKLGDSWVQVDEQMACTARFWIAADTGKRVLKNDVLDVIRSDFARLVHPVREYINALPPWDGRDRVAELAGYVVTDDGELLVWALHKWLVATVATWMSDQVSNHEVFVLIGRQGIYKTTFFRHLLPPPLRVYFWENAHNSFSSKDDHIALTENCLVEIEEVDMSNPRDISELKALATSERIKERRPYARFRQEKHRLASFCATGNQQRFLTDDTGNRRWLCFMVSHIDDPRSWTLNYEQLYAQLRDEYTSGFQYWFDQEDQKRVEEQNAAFTIESDEEQLIRTRLRIPRRGDPVKMMNSTTICQLLNGGRVGAGLSSRKIGMTMKKLGFEQLHTRNGNLFRVYEVPYDQIQPMLCADGYEEPSSPQPQEQQLPF